MIKQIKLIALPNGNYEVVKVFNFPKERFLERININWEKWYSGLIDCWIGVFLIEETKNYFFVGSAFDLPEVPALPIIKNENLPNNLEIFFDSFKLKTI